MNNHTSTTKNSDPKAEVKKRLNDSLLRLFSQSDFHQVNMRMIAKDSSVSFKTIYKHYESKEDLLFNFVDQWRTQLTNQILEHLGGIENTKDKIRKIIWTMLHFYQQNPSIGRIVYITTPANAWLNETKYDQNKVRRVLFRILREGQADGTIDTDIDPILMLDLCLGLISRTVINKIIHDQSETILNSFQNIFDLIWKAICKPEAEVCITQ